MADDGLPHPDNRTTPPAPRDRSSCTGRFAPSPTGPLHGGSLLAALASWLDVRVRSGQWLVRMEDLDPPREQPGASDLILRQLEYLGLHWDGEVLFQSSRLAAYREALAELSASGSTYYCTCTRRQQREWGGKYPGHCRHRRTALPNAAIRCRMDSDAPCRFDDLFQGPQEQDPAAEGDVVVLRRDGLFAYQLAVVVDDAYQGVTRVVRGIDLLDSTARQRQLQKLLGYPEPVYGHIPVLVDKRGDKLSKQTGAKALPGERAALQLVLALRMLRQEPPLHAASGTPAEVLDWAVRHWQPGNLAGLRQLSVNASHK